MLRLYTMLLDLGPEIAARIEIIQKFDSDLAGQARRAYSSTVLNTAEGMNALGGNKRARYYIALGEWNELIGAFDISVRLRYFESDASLDDRMQHCRAILLKLVKPRR